MRLRAGRLRRSTALLRPQVLSRCVCASIITKNMRPARFAKENDRNRLRCVFAIYDKPAVYRLDEGSAPCLKHKPKIKLTKSGV